MATHLNAEKTENENYFFLLIELDFFENVKKCKFVRSAVLVTYLMLQIFF